MLEDNVPNISPTFCFLQDSAIKVREGQETAHVAKQSFKVISLACTFTVIVLRPVPGKFAFQERFKIVIFSIKVVKMELKLGKGIVGLNMGKRSRWSNFVGKIHFDRNNVISSDPFQDLKSWIPQHAD